MPAACLAVFNLRFGTGSSGWASKLSLYFFPTPVVSYKTYSRSGIFICTPVGSESSSSSADGNTLTFSTKLRCQDRLAILDLISTDLRCYRDLVVSDIPLLLAFLVLTLFCHKHMSSVLLRDFLFAVKGAIASRVRARLQEFLLIRRKKKQFVHFSFQRLHPSVIFFDMNFCRFAEKYNFRAFFF